MTRRMRRASSGSSAAPAHLGGAQAQQLTGSAMREIRRLVFLFAGFEPHSAAEQQRARFAYAAEKTGALWDAAFDIGALRPGLSGCAEFHVTAQGAGWEAQTDFVVCDWSDLILAIERQNPVRRFFYGLAALAGFAANGTFLRYCRASWRYGVFFLIPFILILSALAPLALALLGWTGRRWLESC